MYIAICFFFLFSVRRHTSSFGDSRRWLWFSGRRGRLTETWTRQWYGILRIPTTVGRMWPSHGNGHTVADISNSLDISGRTDGPSWSWRRRCPISNGVRSGPVRTNESVSMSQDKSVLEGTVHSPLDHDGPKNVRTPFVKHRLLVGVRERGSNRNTSRYLSIL